MLDLPVPGGCHRRSDGRSIAVSIDAGIQVGVVYPQIELNGDPEAVRSLADAVEAQGYRHLVAYDHVLGADHANREPELTGPYDEDDPFHDPFVLFAYLAGRSETLGLRPASTVPQRQTALVAKQAADLAVLSGDRFRMGVGVGWNPVEYGALGEDFSTRGRRADEQIGLLRRYWSERTVSFAGRFDRVDRAASCPARFSRCRCGSVASEARRCVERWRLVTGSSSVGHASVCSGRGSG